MASKTKPTVKISVQNFHVARFIKFSKEHSSSLFKLFESLAKVSLRQVKYKDDIELNCQALEASQATEQEFERECKEKFDQFLSNYCCTERTFNTEQVAKVFKRKPELFEKQSGEEKEKLFIRWDETNQSLLIAGIKTEVENVFNEIEHCLEDTSRQKSSKFFTFLFISNQAVACFFHHSPLHMSKLREFLQKFATITALNVSRKQSRNEKWAYCCKSLPNSALSEEEFKNLCISTLREFLKNYGSVKLLFHPTHIGDAQTANPEYFKRKQDSESLLVTWLKDAVVIAGVTHDVKDRQQAIVQEVDSIVPRKLELNYAMKIGPPSRHIAKFIHQSEKKHLKFFKLYFKDCAKVWFKPEDYSIHFQALNALSQYDIEEFKETCNKRVVAYFKKFDVWSGNFESQIIKIASEKEKELFQIVDSDWMLEIVKETEVNFVGLKPYFYPQRNAIIKALKEAETERKKQFPSPPAPKYPSYFYSPKEKTSFTVIKHVFQSPLDMAALQHTVGSRIEFKVFPNEMEAHGVEFHPKPDVTLKEDYYHTKIPKRIAEFFQRFLVCNKQVQPNEPDEIKKIVDVVYSIGEASENIIERMISMHIEDNSLDIVGPRDVINEISQKLDATNRETESVPITTEKRLIKITREAKKKVAEKTITPGEPLPSTGFPSSDPSMTFSEDIPGTSGFKISRYPPLSSGSSSSEEEVTSALERDIHRLKLKPGDPSDFETQISTAVSLTAPDPSSPGTLAPSSSWEVGPLTSKTSRLSYPWLRDPSSGAADPSSSGAVGPSSSGIAGLSSGKVGPSSSGVAGPSSGRAGQSFRSSRLSSSDEDDEFLYPFKKPSTFKKS